MGLAPAAHVLFSRFVERDSVQSGAEPFHPRFKADKFKDSSWLTLKILIGLTAIDLCSLMGQLLHLLRCSWRN